MAQTADVGKQSASSPAAGYILGVGDQVTVRVMNLEQIDEKPILIDLSGSIRLPLAGESLWLCS
jgi:protein involved in polysaccharide export with SLBB domain